MDAAKTSRDFERKDTREEAAKALADLKAKGMQVNELSPAEAGAHARQADPRERRQSAPTSAWTCGLPRRTNC